MPLTKLQFKPGINKEGTNYSNEGGYFNCDKVRFRSGYAEKIGGWANISPSNTFVGTARSAFNWVTYNGSNLLALGTNISYYIENGGTYYNITPIRATVTLGSSPIQTLEGSKLVTISATGHGATAGSIVTITSTSTVGGLNINGDYEIVTCPNLNTFTIAASTVAISSSTGGGTVTVVYRSNAGNTTATVGVGWGAGPWGSGGWGTAASTGIILPLKLWSQDTYEQDLLFCGGSTIFYWTADTATYAPATTLTAKSNSVTKTVAAATFTSTSTNTITVDSSDFINVGAVITGIGIAPGTTVLAVLGLQLTLSTSTISGIPSSGDYTFSYSGLFVPYRTNFIIASDTSHFTICLGANPYDPTNSATTFDPMLVRWSDQDNPYEWVPEVTNQSGEQHLSNGSYLVAAVNSRQEILVWSDAALYSMQYIGPPYVWNFTLIGDNTSIISQNAIISVNTVTYWMGVDKFYMYNGRLETLACTIWKFVYENINKNQKDQIVCGSNEGFSEIWWFYPSKNSFVNDSYVIYNYLDQVWYYGTLNRSAWLDSPLRSYPMGVFSIQNSYLSVSIDATANVVSLVDGFSYPSNGVVTIGSEEISYTGITNNTLTGCTRGYNGTTPVVHAQYSYVTYKTPNQVMFHEYGVDDASQITPKPIPAYLESSDFDIGDGHNFGFMWRILPDITFRTSTIQNPQVMLSIKSRLNSGSAYTTAFTDPTNVTRTSTVPVEEYTGQVYTRIRGRQAAFRVDSSELGVAWQVGAMRIDVRQDGRR
jgi:hypothetical protein